MLSLLILLKFNILKINSTSKVQLESPYDPTIFYHSSITTFLVKMIISPPDFCHNYLTSFPPPLILKMHSPVRKHSSLNMIKLCLPLLKILQQIHITVGTSDKCLQYWSMSMSLLSSLATPLCVLVIDLLFPFLEVLFPCIFA